MGVVKEMGFVTTVVALVNGMIGGSILVLPLVAKEAGWAESLLVILVTGVFSYYSCYLSLIHLGDQVDLDHALLRHFNGSKFLKIFYDFCVWSGIMLLLTLYFELIVIQWEGLLLAQGQSPLNPILNGVAMVAWCLCLKFFEFGAHIMGYGVISIAAYLLFLIWVLATAPTGPATIPAFGSGLAGFAAMMGNAYSIQGFFLPVIRCYQQPRKHPLILLLAYLIGGFAYYYIAYMGAYGILNRSAVGNPQTIEGFFTSSEWEVKMLQGIYLVHLYSVFPEYLLISKKRFFSMFNIKESEPRRINLPELLYIVLLVVICLVLAIERVNIDVIIDINGAVLGFCFVYFLPSCLHIKCLYFSSGKRIMTAYQTDIAVGEDAPVPVDYKEDEKENKERKQEIELQEKSPGEDLQVDRQSEGRNDNLINEAESAQLQEIDYSHYYCAVRKPSLPRQALDLTLLTIMLLMGLFIMINGLIQVVAIIRG